MKKVFESINLDIQEIAEFIEKNGLSFICNEEMNVEASEKDFNKLGITLYDADGQLKSTFKIMTELANVYPNLDKNTKTYYASLIGGRVLPRHIVICV